MKHAKLLILPLLVAAMTLAIQPVLAENRLPALIGGPIAGVGPQLTSLNDPLSCYLYNGNTINDAYSKMVLIINALNKTNRELNQINSTVATAKTKDLNQTSQIKTRIEALPATTTNKEEALRRLEVLNNDLYALYNNTYQTRYNGLIEPLRGGVVNQLTDITAQHCILLFSRSTFNNLIGTITNKRAAATVVDSNKLYATFTANYAILKTDLANSRTDLITKFNADMTSTSLLGRTGNNYRFRK